MKKIIINMKPWEARIAVLRGEKLQNIYFGASTDRNLERSFFKGKIVKVFPGIQTAFVEIGQDKAGFLHISELDRDLLFNKEDGVDQLDIFKDQDDQHDPAHRKQDKPSMGALFKEGESVLVQVAKEPTGDKGAKLTTCFTLPGRYIVLMPNIGKIAISKKIGTREERMRLKDMLQEALPPGMGAIVRTSAQGATERELYKDAILLIQDWAEIVHRYEQVEPGVKIYEDLDISLQVVRDHLDDDVEAIITDDKRNQEQVYSYIKNVAPEFRYKIKQYEGLTPIFDNFDIERQIESALHPKVMLKSGGSIIIERTEAMTVVDVNTGKFTGKKNSGNTVLTTNLEAAQEIVRQLRLRNIGGLIVIDFIDMQEAEHKRQLVEFFESQLKAYDKFQSVVLNVSEFGLVQMTRKRSGKRLTEALLDTCNTCSGLGLIPSVRTLSYKILRTAWSDLQNQGFGKKVTFMVHPQVFDFISSVEYNSILALEKECNLHLTFKSEASFAIEQFKIDIT